MRCDVVVSRSDVGGERTEHVEGRLEARLLSIFMSSHLVHRHVAGPSIITWTSCSHASASGSQDPQLGELRLIGGIGQAARRSESPSEKLTS